MIPPAHASDVIAGRLQALKQLYAELFVLLDRSVEEDPLTEEIGGLDVIIGRLMHQADAQLPVFLGDVERARVMGLLNPALESELAEFNNQLRTVLNIVSERIQRRAQVLTRQRDELKGRMVIGNRKRQTAQGYRPFKCNQILESHI